MESIDIKRYRKDLADIEAQWEELATATPSDRKLIIGLPHPYVCPSRVEFDEKMYYWDSYFINLGLLARLEGKREAEAGVGAEAKGGGLGQEKKLELALGMVNNLLHLFERFGFIPQSNRFYHLGKSNPPFLTSMVREVFEVTGDLDWLSRAVKVAEGEYEEVWTGEQRLRRSGLSRYWEPTHTHEQAEDESGWDRTSRFYDRCLDFNPVDLNCLLFKYEEDLAWFHEVLNREGAQEWRRRSRRRRRRVRRLCWDEKAGFYFDFNWVTGKRSRAWTLAGFFPLWAGVATRGEAERMRERLRHFEYEGGLAPRGGCIAARRGGSGITPRGGPTCSGSWSRGWLGMGIERTL